MLKLYGFAVSNYFNMVKLALQEKGLDFEVVNVLGKQDEAFFKVSPRGKVPALETPDGFISETGVILEYIEETQPGRALLPSEPFARAQVRALMREVELYIELPARLCYPAVFFGAQVDQAIQDKARTELLAGVATLRRHARFAPYLAGEEFTLADIYFLYSMDLAATVAKKLFGLDLLAELPGAAELFALLGQNPHVQQIAEDKNQEMAAFLAKVRGGK
jgi:glutathione S-transferase